MSSDWDEIKRLAADFQKAQLSSSLQRLSERNCVEVVSLLIEKELLEVIYTNDGKEYLTQEHLTREMRDELYIQGGRMNLVDVSKTLNVDFQKLHNIAQTIAAEDSGVSYLLGQLIDEMYTQRVASEINEKLVQSGVINLGELTVTYDLPADFLVSKIVLKNLGKIIFGRQDPTNVNIFFTQSYITRCKAKIRGALAAVTKPTPVSAILMQTGVPERLFYMVVNEISSLGSITARSPGAQYIPHIYTRTQVEWVRSFYRQNGYLEHDAVAGLGVFDVKAFIVNKLPEEKIIHLKNCSVGEHLIVRVKASLDECIAIGSYLDVSTVLPSSMAEEDIEHMLSLVLSPSNQRQTLVFGTTILTTKFVDDISKPCNEIVSENARNAVDSGSYQQYMAERLMKHQDTDVTAAANEAKQDKREERRKKAAGGKGGGGTQGRETKTKSTKKHARGNRGNVSDSDEDTAVSGGNKKTKEAHIELVSAKEIAKVFHAGLEPEGLEDLSKQLANHYYPQFSKLALAKAHEMYELSLQKNNQNRRQTHASIQDKLNNLYNDIRLYEKGLKLLAEDVQTQLVKYLLKSLGTDFCNEVFFYVAAECNLNSNGVSLTPEQRQKIAQDCDQEYKAALQALNKAIASSSTVDGFLEVAENALKACSMILKKIDKKKDRNLILCHKHGLLEQMVNCSDPALVLHLAALVIFTISTQTMLHASGRHVQAVLSFLQPSLDTEQSSTLNSYHDLVLKLLSSEQNAEEITKQLEELTPRVKAIASNYKKAGVTPVD